MAKKVIKKNADKKIVKNKSVKETDLVKLVTSTNKDVADLKKTAGDLEKTMNDLKIDTSARMDSFENRLKEFILNLLEEQHRGFVAVYEDTNDRIKAMIEIQTENERISGKLESLDETIYFNYAPRITSLETAVKG